MYKLFQRLFTFCFAGIYVSVCVSAQDTTRLSHNNSILQYHNISLGDKDSLRESSVNIGISGDIDVLNGVQMEMFSSFVRNYGRGYNASLFATITANDFKGLQSAFFINVVGRKMTGVQNSLIVNAATELKGVQIAGFNNICGKNMKGVQFSGVSNISMGIEKGSQISSIMNVCENKLDGFQFSMFNYADTLAGNQLGIINLCVSHPNGLQIGIINYARKDSSSHHESTKWQFPIKNRKIGLVNISRQTKIQMLLYVGNTNKINISARFLNEISYSMLGFGSYYIGLNKNFSGSVFYRTGFYKKITDKGIISTDIGYYHIETFEFSDQSTPERLYSLPARVNFEYKLKPKFALFISCGYELTRYYDKNVFYNKCWLFDMGVILF